MLLTHRHARPLYAVPPPAALSAPPAHIACRWSDAAESIAASNLRLAFAWQRIILRAWWGA